MKKILLYLLLGFSSVFLPGCTGDLIELACMFVPEPDHCYQTAAVQEADPYGCEQIKGEGFTGSNPPRDKCYLQIAENTGDYAVCDNIKGGPMSYTKAECIVAAAEKNDDPAGCRRLTGADFASCKERLGGSITTDKLDDINKEVEDAKSAAGADPEDAGAKKKLADLLEKQKTLFDFAPDTVKAAFFKQSREEIMSGVDDDDVKSEISKIFVDFRNKNPNATLNEQLKKMEEIKDQQETAKRLDEQANTLIDQLKESASGFAGDTFDDLYGEDVEKYKAAMAARGMKYVEENKSLKRGIENLEWMKGKYDKASEQYEAISKQIGKLQKVYSEVSEVNSKVDAINKLVAEGKIDPGKAKVLHGAVYLGKGLEYATGYVPVFGSTISTISKETFDATVKFATKRAERTTALDKCIDDPEHCDPDNITAY